MQTASGVRLGIALPQGFIDGRVDMDLVRRFALRAEELGFEDVWVMEQITGRLAVLEPLVQLGYVAALTSRVRLGTSVLVSTLRNPVQLAKALSSLDQVSGGRVIAGLGLGASARQYRAYGIDPERRVARFVEGVRAMRALWQEPRANIKGEFLRLKEIAMEPKPAQARLPVWLGARTEAALRRAVRIADGWMGAGSEPLSAFLEQLGYVRRLLADEGRDEGAFALSKRVYVAIGRDAESARSRLRPWIEAFYGSPDGADAWAVCGSIDDCVDALAPLVRAGVQHLMLHPLYDNLEQLETIASRLAPSL